MAGCKVSTLREGIPIGRFFLPPVRFDPGHCLLLVRVSLLREGDALPPLRPQAKINGVPSLTPIFH